MLLAGPISHTSTQYMDFVKIFNISLDLSAIYFACFNGCRDSFVFSCHSILECYNLFSGVKLSMRSFCFISVIFHQSLQFTSQELIIITYFKKNVKLFKKRRILEITKKPRNFE